MSSDAPLVLVGQREVEFYGDRLIAVEVMEEAEPEVYVPVRPICQFLGLTWGSQRNRIHRDPVLSRKAKGVFILNTPFGRSGGSQEMLCLPLDFLHGWLFGITVSKVKPEYRDAVLRYQEECYKVLGEAFRPKIISRPESLPLDQQEATADLYTIRVGVNGVLDYLIQRQQHDEAVRRFLELIRLDVHEVGGLIEEGDVLTERQRQTLYQLGLEVAALMAQLEPRQNPFAIVFGSIKKTFKVSTYRELPRPKYRQVYEYLAHWKDDLKRQIREKGEEPCLL